VREQLGREWAEDLELVRSANDVIITSYNQKNIDARLNEVARKRFQDADDNGSLDPLPASSHSGASSTGDSMYSGSFGGRSEKTHAFDRTEVFMLNNHGAFQDMASSPLRTSNFDLLFVLTTQEGIHRTLKSYKKSGKDMEIPFNWLRDFYTMNLEKYFDGNRGFGNADDFLDDLLVTPPSLKTTSDGKFGLVDPLAIAEDIIRIRGEIALEWKNIMLEVTKEHELLRSEIFIRQMEKWGQRLETKVEDNSKVLEETSEFE